MKRSAPQQFHAEQCPQLVATIRPKPQLKMGAGNKHAESKTANTSKHPTVNQKLKGSSFLEISRR
jgi:hypothetical protein